MNDNEVNKIIAEFMGYEVFSCVERYADMAVRKGDFRGNIYKFTKSLDALVPVWEKLEVRLFSFDKWNNYLVDIHTDTNADIMRVKGKTIQQAAAHATAKAILELDERA